MESAEEVRANPSELQGFSIAEALGTRSFWLIAAAAFLFAFTVYGVLIQVVVYLIGLGYGPEAAAIILVLMLGLDGAGKVLFGVVADRIGARIAMALSFAVMAGGIVLLFGVREVFVRASFLAVCGPVWGAALALIPLVTIEWLGVWRWIGHGTNTDSFMAKAPTGRKVTLPGCEFIAIRDDRIHSVVGYFDQLTPKEHAVMLAV